MQNECTKNLDLFIGGFVGLVGGVLVLLVLLVLVVGNSFFCVDNQDALSADNTESNSVFAE